VLAPRDVDATDESWSHGSSSLARKLFRTVDEDSTGSTPTPFYSISPECIIGPLSCAMATASHQVEDSGEHDNIMGKTSDALNYMVRQGHGQPSTNPPFRAEHAQVPVVCTVYRRTAASHHR
jgi:hypothetical protein